MTNPAQTPGTTTPAQTPASPGTTPEDMPETDAPTTTPDATDDEDDATTKARADAGRYRTRLRQAEAERDALRAQVETMQRAEVERLASNLKQPAAIWAAGVNLADLLDNAGNIDQAKANAAITDAAARLGLAEAPRTPKPDPSMGGGSGPAGKSWVEAMRP